MINIPIQNTSYIVTPNRSSKDRIKEELDNETLYRVAYIPYVVGAIAWDYSETLCDQAAIMKIQETKKLSRAIKQLRLEYDRFRQQKIFSRYQKQEMKHCEEFQDIYSDFIGEIFNDILSQVHCYYPKLKKEYTYYLATVYMTMVVLKGLFQYARWCDDKIDSVVGKAKHSILPSHFNRLYALVQAFLGDKDKTIKIEDLEQPISKLVSYVMSIQFTNIPKD
jgi:hypothetical protein